MYKLGSKVPWEIELNKLKLWINFFLYRDEVFIDQQAAHSQFKNRKRYFLISDYQQEQKEVAYIK